MSAMSLALLLTTAAATAVGAAALHAAHGLRKQVTALRTELSEARAHGVTVPAQSRSTVTPVAEIRAAVAEALAEERERELAEARAFWATQEARDAADAPSLLGGLTGVGEDVPFFMPRQADFAGLDAMDLDATEALDELVELTELADMTELPGPAEFAEDSPSWPPPVAGTLAPRLRAGADPGRHRPRAHRQPPRRARRQPYGARRCAPRPARHARRLRLRRRHHALHDPRAPRDGRAPGRFAARR